MQPVYFHLPGAFEFYDFYQLFIVYYKGENDKFYDWAKIGSIYGAPREAFWNGGRIRNFISPPEDFVKKLFMDNDVPIRFTFSNPYINAKYINDPFCNMLLDKFNWPGHQNSVIVNAPILEQYIRKNYPRYGIVSSTTKCITDDLAVRKELQQDYSMVVLDYNYNKRIDFLKSLPQKDKVELLINPVCMPNCPRRKEHYEIIARGALHTSKEEDNDFECINQTFKFHEAQRNALFISRDDIINVYEPMGFRNFKIEGRTTSAFDLAEILAYYMVQPEYRLEMREKFLTGYYAD